MINLILKKIMVTYLYYAFLQMSQLAHYIKPCILLGVTLFLVFDR
jgi:hypothetical protein